MEIDGLIWLATAALLLVGGALGLVVIRRKRLGLLLVFLAAGLVGILAGLGWRTWQADAWPGTTAAETLGMLAGGALAVTAWVTLRSTAPASPQEHPIPVAAAMIEAGLLVGAGAMLSWRESPVTVPLARSGLFGLCGILMSVGLGGWLPALAASTLWSLGSVLARPHAGLSRPQIASSASDPGRVAALFSFPWLTAVGLVGMMWNLAAHTTVVQIVPGDLWCIIAWLTGGIYLHATSGWRPLPLPPWLATVLAAVTAAAAVLAALSAPTVL